MVKLHQGNAKVMVYFAFYFSFKLLQSKIEKQPLFRFCLVWQVNGKNKNPKKGIVSHSQFVLCD